jgi:hypothetical protein
MRGSARWCLLLLAAGPALASNERFVIDARQLQVLCDRGEATFYVLGAMDANLQAGGAAAESLTCLPQQVTASQVVDRVCRFVREVPAKGALAGSTATTRALRSAYPCSRP